MNKIATTRAAYIENSRNPLGFEQLRARGVIVTSQIKELRQDLRRESTNMERNFLSRFRQPMAANPTNLPFLILVIVAANPTWVLSLPLPHQPANHKIRKTKIRQRDWLEWSRIEDLGDGNNRAGSERGEQGLFMCIYMSVGWKGEYWCSSD